MNTTKNFTSNSAFRATDTRVMSRPATASIPFVALEEDRYPANCGPSIGFHRSDLNMQQQRTASAGQSKWRAECFWRKQREEQQISREESAFCLHHLIHEACQYQKRHKDELLAIFVERASQAKQQQQQRSRSSSLSSRGKIRAQNIASSKGVPLLLFLSESERKLHADVDLLLHPAQEQDLREYAGSAISKLQLFAIPSLEKYECPVSSE